jgi:hypothetical protein
MEELRIIVHHYTTVYSRSIGPIYAVDNHCNIGSASINVRLGFVIPSAPLAKQ